MLLKVTLKLISGRDESQWQFLAGLFLASCSCGFAKSHGAFLAQCDAGSQQEPTRVDLNIMSRGKAGSNPLCDSYQRLLYVTHCSHRISTPCHCHSHSFIFTPVVFFPVHFLLPLHSLLLSV